MHILDILNDVFLGIDMDIILKYGAYCPGLEPITLLAIVYLYTASSSMSNKQLHILMCQ